MENVKSSMILIRKVLILYLYIRIIGGPILQVNKLSFATI